MGRSTTFTNRSRATDLFACILLHSDSTGGRPALDTCSDGTPRKNLCHCTSTLTSVNLCSFCCKGRGRTVNSPYS